MFTDRREVGQMLARKLEMYRGKDAIVLALPRGGVVVGYEIAHSLYLPLDIVAVRKIGHPLETEYAVGAVDDKNVQILDEVGLAGVDKAWLTKEISHENKEAQRRLKMYRGERGTLAVAGKVVILVDDGVATGLSSRLAIRSLRMLHPMKIIVAVAVAPPDALHSLAKEGENEIITLIPPDEFRGSIGAHYLHFEQVEEGEVIKLMKQAYEEEQLSSRSKKYE